MCSLGGKDAQSSQSSKSEVPGTEWTEAYSSGQGRDTAWMGSRTEVCGSARRSGRGREEMTRQKGVVTAPGQETRECARRRGAAGSEEGAH